MIKVWSPSCVGGIFSVALIQWFVFIEILFRQSLFFNLLPAGTDVCLLVPLERNMIDIWTLDYQTQDNHNGNRSYKLSWCILLDILYPEVAVWCRFAVSVCSFFSMPHCCLDRLLTVVWLLKFPPPTCALFLYFLFLPNFRGLADC